MRWQRGNKAITDNCSDVTFSLTGEDRADYIEGVEVSKYLRKPLDQSDNNWTVVLVKISKPWQMWGRLRKIIRKEGAEPAVSAKLHRAVIQVLLLLLFWSETWVLLAPMAQRLEVFHVGFLRQVTKLKAEILKDKSWKEVVADSVL